MTERLKYRAKINTKGLDTTGVTEDHARGMAARLGSHHLFIVEARAHTSTLDEEGNQQVSLVLTQVEPVPEAQEETVREFLRALYRQRPEVQGQEVLQGVPDGAPNLTVVTDRLAAAVERDDAGEPVGVWDGDTDGPLTTVYCPAPGCGLAEDHDGDHDGPDEDEG